MILLCYKGHADVADTKRAVVAVGAGAEVRHERGKEPLVVQPRLNIDDTLPHPTTLMKITTRSGEATVEALNEAVLAKANAAKLVKTGKSALTPPWCRPTLTTPPTPGCWPAP